MKSMSRKLIIPTICFAAMGCSRSTTSDTAPSQPVQQQRPIIVNVPAIPIPKIASIVPENYKEKAQEFEVAVGKLNEAVSKAQPQQSGADAERLNAKIKSLVDYIARMEEFWKNKSKEASRPSIADAPATGATPPPPPSIPDTPTESSGPNVAKGENGQGELDKSLDKATEGALVLAGAALCVYQPELCPIVMAIAELLKIGGDVKNATKQLEALHTLATGGPVDESQKAILTDLVSSTIKKGTVSAPQWVKLAEEIAKKANSDKESSQNIKADALSTLDPVVRSAMEAIAKEGATADSIGEAIAKAGNKNAEGKPYFASSRQKQIVLEVLRDFGKQELITAVDSIDTAQ